MGRQEWDRSVAFELFEQHRVADAPWPPLPVSAAAQAGAQALLEGEVRSYYEAHNLLSQPVTLRHYLNAPRPTYLEPLRWLGVSDDLTGADRLDEDSVSYVPVPGPDLPYFYRANAADPRAGIAHEGAHYQQLALSWANPRPARRHFYDSCPNEGLAFYNEEMLTQAGLFDDAPVTRRIIYNFMRLRALRVEVDVRLALGELSIDDAGALLEHRVPMDPETARAEAAFFAATPAQGLSYTVGKLQLTRLLADVRTREGPRSRCASSTTGSGATATSPSPCSVTSASGTGPSSIAPTSCGPATTRRPRLTGCVRATKGAKRAVAVDVTGLPLAATVLPASTHENVTTETLLDLLHDQGQAERLQLVLVDRGVTTRAARSLGKRAALEVRRVGHDKGRHKFVPLAYAWRVEVAHGHLLRSRRLARSFECTPESASGWLQVACLVAVLDALAPRIGTNPVSARPSPPG